jgi:hypothetical protein
MDGEHMSGPFTEDPTFTRDVIECYREMVRIHADDPVLGTCAICGESRCPDWRYAKARLACVGALSTEDGSA